MENLESLYEKARIDSSFRQQFLDSLDLGEIRNYVFKIEFQRYYLSLNEAFIRPLMSCEPIELKGIRIKSKITVYSDAFDEHKNVYDFLSTLKYHEGFHAFENFADSDISSRVNSSREKIINEELRADENTFNHLNSKNSEDYIQGILDYCRKYKQEKEDIWNLKKKIKIKKVPSKEIYRFRKELLRDECELLKISPPRMFIRNFIFPIHSKLF